MIATSLRTGQSFVAVSRLATASAAMIAAVACAHSSASRTTPTASPAPATAQQAVAPSPPTPTNNYWIYVGAESADLLQRVRFGPEGTVVERTIPVGELPTEMEGPHGMQISRDGKYLHMTTGHGSPDGKYWKFELGPDTLVGAPTFLGFFPATIDVTPDGLYAFVANFNLHGEMVPSTVSVVYTPTNTEVAQVTTCVMPHGSRIDPTGLRQYSACMMDDQLVEIDAANFRVSRRFSVAKGKEGPIATTVASGDTHAAVHHDAAAQPQGASPTNASAPTDVPPHAMAPATCSPTWAQPSVDGKKIFVTCNKADEILEIDRDTWTISRRFKTGRGPYNLSVSPDGKLLAATLKPGASFQLFDLATGESVFSMKSTTTVTNGVVISPDSRYAFVSSEGVGAAPGKVDVYDLVARARVGTVDVGQQAGGIAFWKMAPAR
jgi:DNA-binding beta-propeller fold protein YncE